jgi:macrolide-specific efflux system membrane fusion protein
MQIARFLLAILFCGTLPWLVKGEEIEVSSVLVSVIQEVAVPARRPGPLVSVAVEEGSLVAEGDLLAMIDDGIARLESQRAQGNLHTARAESESRIKVQLAEKSLQVAKADWDRGSRSRKIFEGAITDEELAARQLLVDQAELQLQQAKHERHLAGLQLTLAETEAALAERQLEQCRIVSPLAGMVVQLHHRRGEWVDAGIAVVRIMQIDRLRAEGLVSANLAPKLRAGLPVQLTHSPADAPQDQEPSSFLGTLRFVSPEINPVDGRIRVWAEIQNSKRILRPGARAAMRVSLQPASDAP